MTLEAYLEEHEDARTAFRLESAYAFTPLPVLAVRCVSYACVGCRHVAELREEGVLFWREAPFSGPFCAACAACETGVLEVTVGHMADAAAWGPS